MSQYYTLRSIRLHTEQSEETTAFTADLYRMNERIASVSNDGKGGCHMYHFTTTRHRTDKRAGV